MTEYTTPAYLELCAERDSLLAGLEQAEQKLEQALMRDEARTHADGHLRFRVEQAERERKEAAESEARLAQIVVRDKARLASAERERDEWKEILDEARVTRDSLKTRLASVPALVEALREIKFTAENPAKPANALHEIIGIASSALTVYEQPQGKP